jgi:hypothetical protein
MKSIIFAGLFFLSTRAGAEAGTKPSVDYEECLNAVACYSRPIRENTSYQDEKVKCTSEGAVLINQTPKDMNTFAGEVIEARLADENLWKAFNLRAAAQLGKPEARLILDSTAVVKKGPKVTVQQLKLFADHFPACLRAHPYPSGEFLEKHPDLAKYVNKREKKQQAGNIRSAKSKPSFQGCLDTVVCEALGGVSVKGVTCEDGIAVLTNPPGAEQPVSTGPVNNADPMAIESSNPGSPLRRPVQPRSVEEGIATSIVIRELGANRSLWETINAHSASSTEATPLNIRNFFAHFGRCESLANSAKQAGYPDLRQAIDYFYGGILSYPGIGSAVRRQQEKFFDRIKDEEGLDKDNHAAEQNLLRPEVEFAPQPNEK